MQNSDEKKEFLEKINPSILKTMDFEQKKEIYNVLRRLLPPVKKKHLLDVRFSFWFIKRWYFVLSFGRDLRKIERDGDVNNSMILISWIFRIFLFAALLFIILLALYILKSTAGLNVFPDKHFLDLISELHTYENLSNQVLKLIYLYS